MKQLIILLLLSVVSCTCKPPQYYEVTVTSVGGCNKDGRCGVMYSNGIVGDERFPVVGQKIKMRKN